MDHPKRRRAGAPLDSLAKKVTLFAFLSTFGTALVLSAISVRSLHGDLASRVETRANASLERAAEALAVAGRVQPGGPDALPIFEVEALLESQRVDPDAHLLLVDEGGAILAAAPAATSELPERIVWVAPGTAGAIGLRLGPDGIPEIGGSAPVEGTAWQVVVVVPFERAFAPLFGAATRIFLMDVLLVLLSCWVAYRITTAAVRPIETLSDAARHIAQGQFDFEIPEPATQDEIGLLARTFNDMMRRLRGYQSEIESANRMLVERNDELKQAKETFEQLSITDGLTKLHNHRFFQDHLTREIKRVTRSGEPLSMLMVDIDDFKSLNDRFGHAAGDELLMGIARIMEEIVRDSDLLARYGGEEFVVLASNTDMDGAYQLAEKVRTSIAETSFILDDSLRPTRVTVSIGVARFAGDRKGFFHAADRALYRAKAAGKNCVVLDEGEGVA